MEYPKKILFCKFCFLFVLFILSSSAAHAATVDIKNINAVNIKTDSATIRWESDEVVGTSQIDYGTTTSYGFTTTEDQLSYYHETTLTGLNPGTIYHYRIHSKDYDNNATLSGDHTFTTNTQAQLDAAFAADIATRKTQGHVYFVRTDGNDSCNGNQNVSYVSDPTNCAFLTIPKAVTVIASGDSVFVMGGDYTLSGAINISHKSNISFIGKDMPCIRQSNYDAPGFYIPNSDHII
jgi:opacity protein-like surface antigen